MEGWHLMYGMDGLPNTADRCQEALKVQQWVLHASLLLDPSAAKEKVDAAKEEYDRLTDQYRSELLEGWLKIGPGLPLHRSLGTFETGLTEQAERANVTCMD